MLTRLPLIVYVLVGLILAIAIGIAGDQQTDNQLIQPSDSLAVRELSEPNAPDLSNAAAETPRVRRNLAASQNQPMTETNRRALVASLLAAWYIAPQSR